LSVDNYLAFYVPVETKTIVAVIRIMYVRRDIEVQDDYVRRGGKNSLKTKD